MAAKVKASGSGINKNVIASKPVTTGSSAGKAIQTQTTGGALQTIGNTVTQANDSFLGDIVGLINQGSQQANEYSAWAQQNQFAYNSAEAEAQRAYNTQMWEQNAKFNSAEAKANRDFQAEQQDIARAYNTKEAELARKFNASEAEKARQFNANEAKKTRDFNKAEAQANRDWQERLDNTAYQRAVEDLKKAGLNPVLAALNGGAGVGSGATASSNSASGAAASAGSASSGSAGGSQASSGAASSGAASGSNFTGQGNNMSESLALVGAIGNLIGSGVSALGAYMAEKDNLMQQSVQNMQNTLKNVDKKGVLKEFGRFLSFGSPYFNNRQ